MILRVEEVRLELNRALERGQRVGRAAEAAEDEAKAIVRRGQFGILANGVLVGRARRGQIVLALSRESLLIPRSAKGALECGGPWASANIVARSTSPMAAILSGLVTGRWSATVT